MNRQELLEVAKPILFNTEMVRAILDGRKTVTRRVVNLDLGLADTDKNDSSFLMVSDGYGDFHHAKDLCRYKVGDTLYVRETWTQLCRVDENGYTDFDDVMTYYLADGIPDINLCDADGFLLDEQTVKWKPSIHMPKSAARIFLKVTDIRVERLQDITEKQVRKEGFRDSFDKETDTFYPCGYHFVQTWNGTANKKDIDRYGWDANPWVWVIEFERVEIPCN